MEFNFEFTSEDLGNMVGRINGFCDGCTCMTEEHCQEKMLMRTVEGVQYDKVGHTDHAVTGKMLEVLGNKLLDQKALKKIVTAPDRNQAIKEVHSEIMASWPIPGGSA